MATKSENKRFKAACPKTKTDGPTAWLQIGQAYMNKDGRISVFLETTPCGWDGSFYLFPDTAKSFPADNNEEKD